MTRPTGATPAGGGNPLKHLEELLDQPREEGWDQKITDAIELVLQQIKKKPSDPTEIARVVKLRDRISKLPGEDTSSNKASSAFRSIFSSSKSNNAVSNFLDASQKHIQSIYSNFSNEKKKLLEDFFKDIPKEQKETIFGNIVVLVSGITDGYDITYILKAVTEIPSKQWANVIGHAAPLCKGITDGYQIASILNAVTDILSEQRADVIEHATPLCKDITNGHHIASILNAVTDIPSVQRANVIEHAAPLCKDITDRHFITSILKTVTDFLSEQRADVIEHAAPLLKGITDRHFITSILKTVTDFPSEQRADVIERAAPLLNGITNKHFITSILKAILFIAPDDRTACAGKIKGAIDEGTLTVSLSALLKFVFQDEKVKTNSHTFLETTLNTLVDLNQANSLASNVERLSAILGLHDEHPLMQTAIEVKSVSERSTDLKNPYVLFKRLKELAAEKSPFSPPECDIDGQHVIFQPEKFRESAVVSVPRKELPVVKADALQQLVLDLDKRLDALPKDEESKVLKYIKDTTSLSLDGLKAGSLNSAELHGRLSSTADPVDLYTAQLLCIVKYIQDQPNELCEGDLLTPREELLVKAAISIQMCATGKKEGFYGVYHTFLSKEYKLKSVRQPEEGETVEIARVKECIATVIEKKLAEQFSGTNKLMEQLVGTDKIEQGVHQALYLKNLISQFVGLSHSLTFDRNSEVLYDSLVARSREEVLGTFYEHFTPELLTDALQKQVNASLSETKELFNDINFWLPEGAAKTVWDLDEDTYEATLNEHGAVELLILAGYLEKVPV